MSQGQKDIVKISGGGFQFSGGIPPGTMPRIITAQNSYGHRTLLILFYYVSLVLVVRV